MLSKEARASNGRTGGEADLRRRGNPAIRARVGALILCLAIAGCASTRAVNTCPPPKEYSQAAQNQAADELDALPPGSVLGQMIVDYGEERAALRACRR